MEGRREELPWLDTEQHPPQNQSLPRDPSGVREGGKEQLGKRDKMIRNHKMSRRERAQHCAGSIQIPGRGGHSNRNRGNAEGCWGCFQRKGKGSAPRALGWTRCWDISDALGVLRVPQERFSTRGL